MCVVSNVHDHFDRIVPDVQPGWPYPPDAPLPTVSNIGWGQIITFTKDDLQKALDKLLSDFTKAIEAAKVVDELTNQPDCVDPEKAKLIDKVKELTEMLTKVTEFEVVKQGGLKLKPGKYRVVDGSIWKIDQTKIE